MMATLDTSAAVSLREQALAIVTGRRLGKAARAWLIEHCLHEGSESHTSSEYPRQLEALGLVVRKGPSWMAGYAHVLTASDLGDAVLGVIAEQLLAATSHETQHALAQRPPGPESWYRPLCWRDGSRWRRTAFGDFVFSRIIGAGQIFSRWPEGRPKDWRKQARRAARSR